MDTENANVLTIQILRGLSHPLTPTLLRRVLSEVLTRAQEDGQTAIVCADVGDPTVDDALTDLGFTRAGTTFVKGSIRDVVQADDLANFLTALYPPDLALPMTDETQEVEKHFWPLKVIGAEIPTYVVPIQPHWAAQLFDARLADEDLFGAKHKLALALENVYYSASRISIPAGARILWYVSGKGTKKVSQIRACSICQATIIGTPSTLFRSFARLGIYRWRDLVKAAGGDLSKELRAYRFSFTERFHRPVSWNRFQEVLQTHLNRGNPCAGPFQIPESVFQDIYTEGTELVSEHAAVVLSIKPEFVKAIAAGTKKVELRRRFPTNTAGMMLVIYATLPVGAAVGVVPINGVDRRSPAELWTSHEEHTGVSRSYFDQYFEGCDVGHAVELGDFQVLEPITMADMNAILPGFRPPQSYRYLGARTLRKLLRAGSDGASQ